MKKSFLFGVTVFFTVTFFLLLLFTILLARVGAIEGAAYIMFASIVPWSIAVALSIIGYFVNIKNSIAFAKKFIVLLAILVIPVTLYIWYTIIMG